MRRLVIDETVKLALALYKDNDISGYKNQVTLLKNILLSISSTIKPGESPHAGKLEEMAHIKACIELLLQLVS